MDNLGQFALCNIWDFLNPSLTSPLFIRYSNSAEHHVFLFSNSDNPWSIYVYWWNMEYNKNSETQLNIGNIHKRYNSLSSYNLITFVCQN